MGLRTQTVPNHVDGHRDVRWGIDVKIALVGLILTIIFAAGGVVWALSAKLTSLEEKQAATQAAARDAKLAAEAVALDLAAKYATAQTVHATFLTRDEFYKYMAPEIRRQRREP